MSRLIRTRSELTESNQLHNMSESSDSRLLVLDYPEHWGMFYISNNRLTIAKALRKESLTDTIIIARVDNIKKEIGAAFVKIDENTMAFLKLSNIPERYMPVHQGSLIPVRLMSDEQKGKRIAVTAVISEKKLPQGWQYKSAYTVLYKPDNTLGAYIKKTFHHTEINKILTDDEFVYNELKEKFSNAELYSDTTLSLAKLYSLKTKLKEAADSKVYLKCGGYLIINHTEALTVIDVNSGKNVASKKSDKEENILSINKEAAAEVALQMKLRNITGMVLIDFINMSEEASNEELISAMNDAVAGDYVTVKVIDITPLGIMEITRQKIDKPLNEYINIFINGGLDGKEEK